MLEHAQNGWTACDCTLKKLNCKPCHPMAVFHLGQTSNTLLLCESCRCKLGEICNGKQDTGNYYTLCKSSFLSKYDRMFVFGERSQLCTIRHRGEICSSTFWLDVKRTNNIIQINKNRCSGLFWWLTVFKKRFIKILHSLVGYRKSDFCWRLEHVRMPSSVEEMREWNVARIFKVDLWKWSFYRSLRDEWSKTNAMSHQA